MARTSHNQRIQRMRELCQRVIERPVYVAGLVLSGHSLREYPVELRALLRKALGGA